MDQETKAPETFREVGVEAGLAGQRLALFVAYMLTRWSDREADLIRHGNAAEWAREFALGYEFSRSDPTGKTLLRGLYGTPYPECRIGDMARALEQVQIAARAVES